MAKSQETYNKKEKEKKRLKKRMDKQAKKEERKRNAKDNGPEDMFAYVDENGVITDTPPDENRKKRVIKAENIELGVPKREKEEIITTRTGKIDFFNDSKGFGFIKEEGTGDKYFVHVNGLLQEVVENDKVTFELEQGLKGLNAVKVTKI
jgi:cold shock CspA family protein